VLKKVLIILLAFVLLGFIGDLIFRMLLGVVLRDTYTYVTVPVDQYVSWSEIENRPKYVSDEYGLWFNDLLEKDVLKQLTEYMKDNNLLIVPGEYHIAGVKNLEDLKKRLTFGTQGDGSFVLKENVYG